MFTISQMNGIIMKEGFLLNDGETLIYQWLTGFLVGLSPDCRFLAESFHFILGHFIL